jgi:PAS domain S-box-containing protein
MVEHNGGTILIVEDDVGVAKLQRRRLERAGYRVTCAVTADEAWRRIKRGGVELVLLDYRLPGEETGLDFYTRLKESGHDLPVILVTGFSDEATVVKALRAGVRDFVTKSVEYLDYLPEAACRVLKQVRTESELEESQARAAAILGAAMDAVLAVDADGRVTLFNPAAEQMFGRPAAAALGRPVGEFVRGGLSGSPAEANGGAGGRRLELTGVRAGGEEFPLEAALSPVVVPGHAFRVLIARDVTERKRAEGRLREQAALLDAATDAIQVRDADDRILYWNRSCERLYGWPAAEAVGRRAAELLYAEPPPELEEARRALAGRGEWVGELRQAARDGREVVVASRWTLLRDEAGRPKGALVINTDITERKRMETQHLRTHRLESIGRLAGGIAHDLNNVLAQFLVALECLREELPPEDRAALLDDLRMNAERGAGIVKQVLSFASGGEGRRVVFQPRHVLREVEKMLGHAAPPSVEVRAELAADLWPVSGDPTQFYQAAMNLCVNAVDAMPQGGRLTLAAQNVSLDETYAAQHAEARPGPFVRLRVIDTGVGIPPDVLERVFDPFFTTKGPGKGTGLGLATVRGIVKAHGGFLAVYSEVGKGTEFSAYLPAAEGAPAAPEEERRRELPAGRGELILVADDEASFRQVAKVTLETFGYRVLTAADGVEAVAIYARQPAEIHAVLADMRMPLLDGAALIRVLHKLNPRVRVVASSGRAGNGPAGEAAGLNVRAFLQKPYTAEALLRTLREVLDAP